MAGHLDQQRQHSHQTQPEQLIAYSADHDDTAAIINECQEQEGLLILSPLTGKAFMDLTGRFPTQSRSGYNYILVLVTDDHNYIHVEPMKNRSAPEYVRAFTSALFSVKS